MANAQKPETTPEQVNHAHELWVGFTNLMKYGIVFTILVLAVMALFLV